ncbi:MAG: recombination regulator RecX [Acidiferrobacterales bacterium]|nr:recombination regulator RecX [Acidiferrobacterales bacterium]
MRILNSKKSSDSLNTLASESGESSLRKFQSDRVAKFAQLKASITTSGESESLSAEEHQKNLMAVFGKSQDSRKNVVNERVLGAAGHSHEETLKKEYLLLFQKGIHLLSMREHSAREIMTKLSRKSARHDLVSAVIDKLVENGYLSNSRFAESYVRTKQLRGFGPSKIRKELLEKGIKHSMIESYLKAESAVWYDNAQNQYAKKYGDEPISDYNSWTKRARFMQSRGFTMEHIHSTLPPVDND